MFFSHFEFSCSWCKKFNPQNIVVGKFACVAWQSALRVHFVVAHKAVAEILLLGAQANCGFQCVVVRQCQSFYFSHAILWPCEQYVAMMKSSVTIFFRWRRCTIQFQFHVCLDFAEVWNRLGFLQQAGVRVVSSSETWLLLLCRTCTVGLFQLSGSVVWCVIHRIHSVLVVCLHKNTKHKSSW